MSQAALKAATGITAEPKHPVTAAIAKSMNAMRSVLPAHITPERMSRIALGMLRTQPKLAVAAQKNPESFAHAILLASQLGLEPGVQGMCYLVPYGSEIQMLPGYRGLMELARRSGQISSIEAHLVYERDDFELALGLEQRLVHKPRIDGERGKPVLVYCIARFKDGGHHFEWMSIIEVNRIRDTKSKASKSGPWVDDYEEMVRKTIVRRASKYWPMSVEFISAATTDDAQEAGHRAAFDGDFLVVDDHYTAERERIAACNSLADIARLLNEMSPETKADLMADLAARQDAIKAAKADSNELTEAEKAEAGAREKAG